MTLAAVLVLVCPAASAVNRPVSAGEHSARHPAQAGQAVRRAPAETCRSARKAVVWYRARARSWAHKMGQPGPRHGSFELGCPAVRKAASFWRAKAALNRRRYERWAHDYAWWLWLPAKWVRIARCETGVRWDWTQPSYISAFGIYRSSWYAFGGSHWTGHNTPREQFEVASRIHARYGWSAWGCGGA